MTRLKGPMICSNCATIKGFMGTRCYRKYYNEPDEERCRGCKKIFSIEGRANEPCPFCGSTEFAPVKGWMWFCPNCDKDKVV